MEVGKVGFKLSSTQGNSWIGPKSVLMVQDMFLKTGIVGGGGGGGGMIDAFVLIIIAAGTRARGERP